MSVNRYPIFSDEEELTKEALCSSNINNAEAGCNVALASQKKFFKNVVDCYVPYDYVTTMSFKYDRFKKKDKTKLSKVKCEWVMNKCDNNQPMAMERLVSKLDPDGAPELEQVEKKLFGEDWHRWVPVDGTTDLTMVDRQLENDIEVMSSPYRTTEKSVLTMMLPIKPFIVRTSDDNKWNRFPLNRPFVYAKRKQTNAPLYFSMMHKYYHSIKGTLE